MPFRSAMLQSWNKFCFTGGIVEFRAKLPQGGYSARAVDLRQPRARRLPEVEHRAVAVVVTTSATPTSCCRRRTRRSASRRATTSRPRRASSPSRDAAPPSSTSSRAPSPTRAPARAPRNTRAPFCAQFLAPFSVTNPSARPQVRRRLGAAVARRAGVLQPPLFGFPTARAPARGTAASSGGWRASRTTAGARASSPPRRLSAPSPPAPRPASRPPPASDLRRPPVQVRPAVWVRLPHRLPRRPLRRSHRAR